MSPAGGASGNLAKYWGTVVSSVNQRASTADLWSALKSAAANNPSDLAGVSIGDVNAMRSAAAGIRAATDAFQAADLSAAIDSTMVAQTPFSADLGAQAISPVYNVSFERTFINDQGVQEVEMRTDRFVGGLPGTVQDLLDTVANDMDTLYGGTTTAVGTVSITMGR